MKCSFLIAGLMAALLTPGCSPSLPSTSVPSRTPRAVALSEATQTPWIIYVPVTTTPEPVTATPLPTVTLSGPTRTNTRPPATAAPATRPLANTATPVPSPTPAGPTRTPVPSCGEVLNVAASITNIFPEDGATRNASSRGGPTIQFKFPPLWDYEVAPDLGYRVRVAVPRPGGLAKDLYMSHNRYLQVRRDTGIFLDGRSLYFMTGGDDIDLQWTVAAVKVPGGFNDQAQEPIGNVILCGGEAGPFRVFIQVVG